MLSADRTLDEFAVPEEAQEKITQHRPQIEHLFGVELNILGVLESAEGSSEEPQGARNIWLQLQGCRENLQRAKEYIKGLCAPELSKEVDYPKDMQCIFLGAHGLFLNCLTKGTSANLTSLHPGTLLISGLAESFVMAQSRIQEFVEKHQKNPKLPDEREAQVKRAFRDLVEMYDDKHTIDLLILPTSVKEELLNLVKEIQQEDGEQRQKNGCWLKPGFENNLWKSETVDSGRSWFPHKPQNIFGPSTGFPGVREQSRTGDSSRDLPVAFARPHECLHKPQGSIHSPFSTGPQDTRTHLLQDQSLSEVSELDFSRGLDKTKVSVEPEDLVCGLSDSLGQPEAKVSLRPVLPRSSPKPIPARKAEFSKPWFLPDYEGLMRSSEHHQEEQKVVVEARESSPVSLPEETSEEEVSSEVLLSSYTEKEFKMMLNFFKTMGYEEEIIKKILLEGGVREAPSTILDRVQMAQAGLSQKENTGLPRNEPGEIELPPSPPKTSPDENEYLRELIKTAMANCGHSPSQIPAEIQTGAPLAGLLRQLNEKEEQQEEAESATAKSASAAKPDYGGQPDIWKAAILNHGESPQYRTPQERGRNSGSPLFGGDTVTDVSGFLPDTSPSSTFLSTLDSERSRSAESPHLGLAHQSSIPTVTGAQRFEEALQTEFKLKLTNTPGKKNLRMIIIDGSNVAMMHGLNQFFSCRGIALAVQYFWDRGHRDVTVLVPAHRLEEDANVRERHFLVELHNLSILSLTPSRKIDGKGIVPYDDRFMLQLAEKTNGVIVTNDQFRDLAKESKKWVKIIKESLLQYIFVGNIFMVPDDPLGRDGPTLAEFLKKKLRTSSPNCHTFSGRPVPSTSPTSVRPASQTEVLQLRERRPPGRLGGSRRTNPQDYEVEEVLRPAEETERLRKNLLEIFVGQDKRVDFVLMREPCCLDLNKLSDAILSLHF